MLDIFLVQNFHIFFPFIAHASPLDCPRWMENFSRLPFYPLFSQGDTENVRVISERAGVVWSECVLMAQKRKHKRTKEEMNELFWLRWSKEEEEKIFKNSQFSWICLNSHFHVRSWQLKQLYLTVEYKQIELVEHSRNWSIASEASASKHATFCSSYGKSLLPDLKNRIYSVQLKRSHENRAEPAWERPRMHTGLQSCIESCVRCILPCHSVAQKLTRE